MQALNVGLIKTCTNKAYTNALKSQPGAFKEMRTLYEEGLKAPQATLLHMADAANDTMVQIMKSKAPRAVRISQVESLMENMGRVSSAVKKTTAFKKFEEVFCGLYPKSAEARQYFMSKNIEAKMIYLKADAMD